MAGAAATALTGSLVAYLGLLTAFGVRRTPKGRDEPASDERFAIMVPAHNEEASIGEVLDALRRLDHSRFSVHVVADNCTDGTADVVRASGFTVYERDDFDNRGKGPALNWLFDHLDKDDDESFDVVVVIDADTIVEAAFLTEIERALAGDVMAVQGHYSVRQPDSSPVVGLRAAALAARHHLRPMGRVRLGGSCGLFGNGMAFRRELLRRHRWTGHLVEDLELQIDLLLDGVRVMYAPDARVYAEMPASLERAESQNQRWELGRLQVLRTNAATLARRSLRGPRDGRIAAADALFDLMVPPLSVLGAAQVLLAGFHGVGAVFGGRRQRMLLLLDLLGLLTLVAHVLIALRSVGAPKSAYRSLARAPGYVLWKARLWLGALTRPDRIGWTRTRRNVEQG